MILLYINITIISYYDMIVFNIFVQLTVSYDYRIYVHTHTYLGAMPTSQRTNTYTTRSDRQFDLRRIFIINMCEGKFLICVCVTSYESTKVL